MCHIVAAIAKSGLEIKNRCMEVPGMNLVAATIAKSGPEIRNRCMEVPGMNLVAATIAKSGPEIRNRCTEVPGMNPIVAAIAKSGPEIGNHCSAIVPSSRIARLRSRCRDGAASDSNFLRRKVELPACCFAVVAGKNGPPAALWFSQGRIARLQLYRCRKEELPACRMTVAGAGGDRLPRRRHNPK